MKTMIYFGFKAETRQLLTQQDKLQKLWSKLIVANGRKPEYPQPYAQLTEIDHQDIRVFLDRHKEHHLYLCLAIKAF